MTTSAGDSSGVTTGTTTGAGGNGAGGSTNATCPPSSPSNGSSCTTEGQTCSYPWCVGTLDFKCTGGLWMQQSIGSCNPPPPVQQCPVTEPTPGESCFGMTPVPCRYLVYCCGQVQGSIYFFCSGSRWKYGNDADVFPDSGWCSPCSGEAGPVLGEASIAERGEGRDGGGD
jgi:hypothetical protein